MSYELWAAVFRNFKGLATLILGVYGGKRFTNDSEGPPSERRTLVTFSPSLAYSNPPSGTRCRACARGWNRRGHGRPRCDSIGLRRYVDRVSTSQRGSVGQACSRGPPACQRPAGASHSPPKANADESEIWPAVAQKRIESNQGYTRTRPAIASACAHRSPRVRRTRRAGLRRRPARKATQIRSCAMCTPKTR
jgi:hypothetical protein